MTTRKIDSNNDWTFGKGKGNYITQKEEVAQNIKTRLQSFIGDCFASLNEGLDWFNMMGSKNLLDIRLAISARILNTENVTRLNELDVILNEDDRSLSITYSVDTSYGQINEEEIEQGI